MFCVALFSGNTEKTQEKAQNLLIKETLMNIYRKGYKDGALNVLNNGTYSEKLRRKDSIEIDAFLNRAIGKN